MSKEKYTIAELHDKLSKIFTTLYEVSNYVVHGIGYMDGLISMLLISEDDHNKYIHLSPAIFLNVLLDDELDKEKVKSWWEDLENEFSRM